MTSNFLVPFNWIYNIIATKTKSILQYCLMFLEIINEKKMHLKINKQFITH